MSEVGWNDLPVLPLRCILQHLSMRDVLTATATCRNWRHVLPLCNRAHKETLLLIVTEADKGAFLTEIYGRNAKKLQLHLNSHGAQFDDFVERIIPTYNHISNLEEITLIGPAYLQLQPHVTTIKIENAALDNLILGQMNNLKNLTILGCNFLPDNPFMSKSLLLKRNIPIYLPYSQQKEEPYLSQCIRVRRDGCQFNSLRHICIDYEMLHPLSLMEMSNLPNLTSLSINVMNSAQRYERLNWLSLNEFRQNKIEVTLNIIGVPSDRFDEIMDNILVDELPLVALRVLFCQTFQPMLIHHIVQNYSSTLVELQWVDSQFEMSHMDRIRDIPISSRMPAPYTRDQSVNPFILVCWQCKVLQKLVIHGYWLWHYDLLGMARLRHSTLRELEISATYQKDIAPKAYTEAMSIIPVFVGKKERTVQPTFVKQMNDCLQFEWRPSQPWSDLHQALGPNSNEKLKSDYIRRQILAPAPLGNT